MQKLFITVLFAAMALLLVPACKKNKNPSPQPPEEQIIISTDAAAFSEVPGPGTNFNLTVISGMPAAGVKIAVIVKGETDNIAYYTSPFIETTLKTTNIFLQNLPRQKICICTVTVTSKNQGSNVTTTSFRIVYK